MCVALLFASPWTNQASAHPHVFVEANIELVRDAENNLTELRQVWRFDELFSSTLVLDYDENTDGKLDAEEISKITAIVKESIAEYDFYTAIRSGSKAVEFYEPDEIKAYVDDGRMIMFLSVAPSEKVNLGTNPVRVSASDTSYYVAFEFEEDDVTVTGGDDACNIDVTRPDFDSLYATNADTLTEAFFNDPQNTDFGDEFFSWAVVKC